MQVKKFFGYVLLVVSVGLLLYVGTGSPHVPHVVKEDRIVTSILLTLSGTSPLLMVMLESVVGWVVAKK